MVRRADYLGPMPHPALLIVTGASGAGKTTLVRGLEHCNLPGVRCHFFDSIGVPSPEEMVRQFGGGEQWQNAMTERWIARLASETPSGSLAVLDGQVRPSVAMAAHRAAPQLILDVLLVDCSQDAREHRLRGDRGQPELATPDMAAWAAYLRGQADALSLPRLDTTDRTIEEGIAVLADHVTGLLARAAG